MALATRFGGATAAALMAAGCGSTSTSAPTTASTPGAQTPSGAPAASATSAAGAVQLSLTARDFAFEPTSLQVPANAMVTITLRNTGPAKHNFTAEQVKANTDMDVGSTTTASFLAPASGSIAFHCEYHPAKMTGTITVAGSGVPAAPVSTPTPEMHHSMGPGRGY